MNGFWLHLFAGALFVAHGTGHLPGFAAAFKLSPNLQQPTAILSGRVQLSGGGVRTFGLLWLAASVAFCVVGSVTLLGVSWWLEAGAVVAAASLLLCLLNLPDTRLGLWVNLVILAGWVLRPRLGW